VVCGRKGGGGERRGNGEQSIQGSAHGRDPLGRFDRIRRAVEVEVERESEREGR
jgi:hypothetical protein